MPIIRKSRSFLMGLLLALPTICAAGQPSSAFDPVELAQKQITAYLANLADLHCTELVTQEKLTPSGHVETSERAKYDYLIMMNGTGDDFQLNESRIEASSKHQKAPQKPMLVSNGLATVLLVFHPYYRDSFKFEPGPVETLGGRAVIPVHFTHIPGRRTPAALALRGREFPLELQGTAWLDKLTGDVVKIDASLLRDMSDVGLRSLNVHVDYKIASLGKTGSDVDVPAMAVVDVTTPRQRWRNTHVFEDYKGFSTDAEQDPNVKIRAANAVTGANDTAEVVTKDSKESKEKP